MEKEVKTALTNLHQQQVDADSTLNRVNRRTSDLLDELAELKSAVVELQEKFQALGQDFVETRRRNKLK